MKTHQKKIDIKNKKNKKKALKEKKNKNKIREFWNILLGKLQVIDAFNKLPKEIKESILSYPIAKLKIDVSDIDPKLGEVFENLIEDYFENYFDDMKIKDTLSIYPLNELFLSLRKFINLKEKKAKDSEEIKLIKEHVDQILSVLDKKMNYLHAKYGNYVFNIAAQEVLKKFSQVDVCYYPSVKIEISSTGKPYPLIKVHKVKISEETLTVDEAPRKLNLCKCFSSKGLIDLTIEQNKIGNLLEIPVYVQDHAIRRLEERLGVIGCKGYLHDCLGRSIKFCKITPTDIKNFYFLDYDFYGIKLGYLVISNEGGFALVRSFKFITMTGTPEYKKLSKLLKADRIDFEYLKLDSLETFMNSDINQNTKIKRVFSKCNLDHLFENNILLFKSDVTGVAKDVLNYFKL